MKKKGLFIFFLLYFCLFIFNSCGLEVYVVLDEPTRISGPELTSIEQENDYLECVFKFTTSESAVNNSKNINNPNYKFKGTAVFYKIYKCYSQMKSEYSTISSKLSSSTAKYNTADYLISTCGYQELGLNGVNVTPLINEDDFGADKYANKTIWIRLSNYGSEDSLKAVVSYVKDVDNKTELGVPTRYSPSGTLTFDFGRTSQDENRNKIPDGEDIDVDAGGSESSEYEHSWYVQLYAASVVQDSNYVLTYSPVEFLGSVKIKDDSTDN